MTNRQFLLILIPFISLIIIGLLLYPGKDTSAKGGEPIQVEQSVTIAMVSSDPEQARQELKPFVDFINPFLDDQEIHLNPYVAESESAMSRAILNGEVDFYLNSPFSVYRAVKTGKMKAVARQWRDGVAEYHSVILARPESAFQGIHDLSRRRIAFEDSGSSSAYFLPAFILTQAGYRLLDGASDPGEPDKPHLHYFFSGREETSLEWLLEGKVDLAAVSSIFYSELPPEMKTKVQVIGESPKIPRYLLAIRSDLDPVVEDTILAILMDMETSSEGRAVLGNFYNTRRFDLIPYENELRQQLLDQLETIKWEP
jgi:phosphonate transport system substrate-binding protein